ncbi:MAG: DUF917 domain-containing protein, partial [Clostridia bacterium]|nr:DUF917 domain-containing protein [Clostridia bacterium]
MRTLDAQAIEDIALGAAVLGTGGGGDPFIGKLMALQTVEECGPIRLISLDEVPDDAVCVPIGMMGAPTVVVEKLPSGTEMESAFSLLSDFLGRPIDAAVPVEAGGLNSMIPLALAGRLGLPVVDGDGMGRAFPELQLSTFHLAGVEATPMVIADEKGNSVILKATDAFAGERIARANCVVMGGYVMATAYTMTGAQVKRAAIGGIVTFSEEIGRTLRTAAHRGLDPIEELLRVTRGHRLFHGKIV